MQNRRSAKVRLDREKKQSRPQTVRFKTRRREKVKVLRGPMTELQRQAGSAVEDEIRRHSIHFRPQPQLGLWQDVYEYQI